MPGSDKGAHGYPSYLLDAISGLQDCPGDSGLAGGLPAAGLGLIERQLALADQTVLAITGDPALTWPGHQRDTAFVATSRGIYVGAVDNSGDQWALVPGSPGGATALAASKNRQGDAVILAVVGSAIYRLVLKWPPPVPSLVLSLGQPPGNGTPDVVQGQSLFLPCQVTSVAGFHGQVEFRNIDPDPTGTLLTSSPWQYFPVGPPKTFFVSPNSRVTTNYTLNVPADASIGPAAYYPVVEATNGSAYAGAFINVLNVVPPLVPLVLSTSPSSLALRAGTSGTLTVTVKRGPQWTPLEGSVVLTATSSDTGVHLSLNPSVVSLAQTSEAVASLSVAVDQRVPLGQVKLAVVATSGSAAEEQNIMLRVLTPVPTSFRIFPSPPADVYRLQEEHLTVEAPGSDGKILSDYSGPWGMLTDTLGGLEFLPGLGGGGPVNLLFVNGQAQTSVFFGISGKDRLIVTDASGIPKSISNAFLIEHRPVAFAFNRIGTQTVGQSFTVTVRAVDASGNTVTLYHGKPWLADRSGFIYEHIGPFVNGTWTGEVNVPVIEYKDAIKVGDPGSSWLYEGIFGPVLGAFNGTSNTFNVLLPNPVTGPGGWPEFGYNGGATYYNPASLITDKSLSGAKVIWKDANPLARLCASVPGIYSPVCHNYPQAMVENLNDPLYAGYIWPVQALNPTSSPTLNPIVVSNGVLLPGWLAGIAAKSGRLLWLTHEGAATDPVVLKGNAIVCRQGDLPPWGNLGESDYPTTPQGQGIRAVSILGEPKFGPENTSCSYLVAGSHVLYAFQGTNELVAIDPTSGKVLWNVSLPYRFPTSAQLYSYYDDQMIRVTHDPIGSLVIVYNPVPAPWLGVAHQGHWLWQKVLGEFPYGKTSGERHWQYIVLEGSQIKPFNAELHQILNDFKLGAYSGFATAISHLEIVGIEDEAAYRGVIYLAVSLKPVGTSSTYRIGNGIIAIDAATGRPIWSTVVWRIMGTLGEFQLVITPTKVIAVSYNVTSGETPNTQNTETVMALNRQTGAKEWINSSLPPTALVDTGTHASAGGNLPFLGGEVVDITNGHLVGWLPGTTSVDGCDQQRSPIQERAIYKSFARSTVVVAGNWLFYYGCAQDVYRPSTGAVLYAVELPLKNVALQLAEQAWQQAIDPPSSVSWRAREAAIAAALFRTAGDISMAEKAQSLATKLGWHPLPTVPPRAHPLPKAPSHLGMAVVQLNNVGPWPIVIGSVVGLVAAAFVLIAEELFIRYQIRAHTRS